MLVPSHHHASFEQRWHDLPSIGPAWYAAMQVSAFCSEAPTRSASGGYSEEWYRARLVHFLVTSGLVPPECVGVEILFPKGNGGKSLRADIIIFRDGDWRQNGGVMDRDTRSRMLMVGECKRSGSKIEDAVEKQLRPAMNEYEGDPSRTTSQIIGVYFDNEDGIILLRKKDNLPLRRLDFQKSREGDALNLTNRDNLSQFPSHAEMLKNADISLLLEDLSAESLDPIDHETFGSLLQEINRLRDRSSLSVNFHTLLVQLLTLKVCDERTSLSQKTKVQFYIRESEATSAVGLQSFRKRMHKLLESAKEDYPNVLRMPIFSYTYEQGAYRPNSVATEKFVVELVRLIQLRAIITSRNEAFNQTIFNNFGSTVDKAQDKQFFTPIPLTTVTADMLHPLTTETVADPCAGICDFLAAAFRKSRNLHARLSQNSDAANLYGFDKDENVLRLAELNLVLNGDGGATLLPANSLTQKMTVDGRMLNDGEFSSSEYDLMNWAPIGQKPELKRFHIVLTNPPFGRGRNLKTGGENGRGEWTIPRNVVELYETYWIRSSKLIDDKGRVRSVQEIREGRGLLKRPAAMDMGVMFLENTVKLLRSGGRFGIILSSSIASTDEWENVRAWLLTKVRLAAMVDLPQDTFGETGVATTLLIGYKPVDFDILGQPYKVFSREIKNVGYKVKTKDRLVAFEPVFRHDWDRGGPALDGEGNRVPETDLPSLAADFRQWLRTQEREMREAFHV